MGFLPVRPSLDGWIRDWCESKDDNLWAQIAKEICARADKRARRYGFSPDDREDIAGEVIARLLELFDRRGADHVRDFDKYVWRVISNACKRQIRRDKPVWKKLKGEIVESLRGKRGAEGLAFWESGDEEMGGYTVWKEQGIRWTPRYLEFQQDNRSLRRHLDSVERPERMPLPELLKAIFDWLETPLPVNELTTLVFDLQGLQERGTEPSLPLEALSSLPVKEMDPALLQTIADAFRQLPRRESAALLFHFQPEVAEQLLIRLSPDGSESAAIPLLAEHLGMSSDDLTRALDDEIPWRDLRIAALLGIRKSTNHATQQEIINLRQRALRFIRQYAERTG